MNVRPVTPADREWIAELVTAAFGSVRVVSHGELIEDASLLDGFAVEHDGRPVGCALVNVVDGDAELVVLVTTYRGAGAGTTLLEAVVDRAQARGLDAALAHHEQRQHRRDPPVPARGLGLGRLPPRRDHARRGRSSPRSPRPATTASRSATRSSSSTPSNVRTCVSDRTTAGAQ